MSMSLSVYIVEPEEDDIQWIGRPSNLLHDLFYGQTGDSVRKHLSADDLHTLQPIDWPAPADLPQKTKDAEKLRAALERVVAVLRQYEHEFPRT